MDRASEDPRLAHPAAAARGFAGALVAALCVMLLPTGPAPAAVFESGDFVDAVEVLRDQSFSSNSNLYLPPSPAERTAFRSLAEALLAGNEASVDAQAGSLGYERVVYTDVVSGDVFQGVRELLSAGAQTRGWGSFFVSMSPRADVMISVPHPRFDTNSWAVAARAFRDAGARGFGMAGAHRNANGPGTADVAHLSESVFQEVHEVWNGPAAALPAWQIHGFAASGHTFPAGTDAVLSNGDGGISSEIATLDAKLTDSGFLAFAYATLPLSDPLIMQVNDGVSGTTFSSLGATTNVQGIHSRTLGGLFVHVELEQSIRFNAAARITAAEDLAVAMLEAHPVATGVPSLGPLGAWLLATILGAVGATAAGRRQRKPQSLQ